VAESETRVKKMTDVMGRMENVVKTSANSSSEIYEGSKSQLGYMNTLQNSLDLLYSTLKDTSSKVEVTTHISTDLTQMAGELNKLIGGFSFKKE
jgi:methyl-accepting chemotaxis protein